LDYTISRWESSLVRVCKLNKISFIQKSKIKEFLKTIYSIYKSPVSPVSLIYQTLRFDSILRDIIKIQFFQNIQISSFSTLRVIGRRFGLTIYTYSWRALQTAFNDDSMMSSSVQMVLRATENSVDNYRMRFINSVRHQLSLSWAELELSWAAAQLNDAFELMKWAQLSRLLAQLSSAHSSSSPQWAASSAQLNE
jgi:hypothetical protein